MTENIAEKVRYSCDPAREGVDLAVQAQRLRVSLEVAQGMISEVTTA